MEINHIYKLKLNILTPVFIGAGKEKDWIKGLDFIFTKENLFIFDQQKLFSTLFKKGLNEKYLELISQQNVNGIEKFFNENFSTEELEKISLDHRNVIANNRPNNEIKTFIRNGLNQPYIPGSSIKGAIRSILFNYIFNSEKLYETYNNFYDKSTNKQKTFKTNSKEEFLDAICKKNVEIVINDKTKEPSQIINLAFGNFDKSIMRFIRPYDIMVDYDQLKILDVDLYNVKRLDNNPKSETKKIGITLECLWPNEDQPAYDFQLNIAEPFVQKYIANYSSCFPIYSHDVFKGDKNLTIHHLFKIINEYTFNHIEKEIQFFSKYTHKEGIDKGIIATLNNLRNKTINNKRSCILRMSYGSGLHGITGDWLFDSHEIDNIIRSDSDKSRRIGADVGNSKNEIDNIRSNSYKSEAFFKNKKTAKSRRIIDSYVLGFVELILPDEIPDIENPFQ